MRVRLPARFERLDLAGSGGWLLFGLFVLVVALASQPAYWPRDTSVPFLVVWPPALVATLAAAAVGVARFRPASPRLRPVEAIAIAAVMLMVMTDVTGRGQFLRDLGIYLKAGHHFLDGAPVYLREPMTVQPLDRTDYPFLYPPLTLPLFALLALMPVPIAQAIWLAFSLCLVVAALRRFGVPWRWAVLAPLWPPLFGGLWVGNVSVPALLLFAVGPWIGASLVLAGAFKSYTGLAALWLVRERRWRAIAVGLAGLVLIAAVTLPLTGAAAWSDWLRGLELYQESQSRVPALYGFGLGLYVPFAVYAVLAAAAVLAALRARGRESLARFGVATVVASPSLFEHGLLVSIPSLMSLRPAWMWAVLGWMALPQGLTWWLGIAVIAASWLLPGTRGEHQPWPDAPELGSGI